MGLVDLTVTLWYNGPKAQDFYPGSNKGITILKDDLVTLKLPHPKRHNITIKKLPNGTGECVFIWPSATYRGVLYNHLKTRIYGPDDDGARKRLLNQLLMLSLHEVHHVPASRKNERVHDDMQPKHRNKQWCRSDMPSGGPALRNEAQMLLDDMASALKIPKSEPIDPPIPNSPARDSVASSVPSPPTLGLALGLRSNEREFGSPMSISPSWQASSMPIKVQPISPTIPPLALDHHEPDFTPPGLSLSTQSQTQSRPMQTQFPPMQKQTQTQTQTGTQTVTQLPTPALTSLKRSRSPSLDLWSRRTGTRPIPAIQPTPNGNGTRWNRNENLNGNGNGNAGTQAKVARLTRELWDVRRQITAGVAREASIMSELRTLDPQHPDANANTSRKALEDAAMRARLQEVEAELVAERKLRVQAEAALADVQRECREPFVVPALFDAFFMISKVTTQVVDSLKSETAT